MNKTTFHIADNFIQSTSICLYQTLVQICSKVLYKFLTILCTKFDTGCFTSIQTCLKSWNSTTAFYKFEQNKKYCSNYKKKLKHHLNALIKL